jgi:hypothetical protein
MPINASCDALPQTELPKASDKKNNFNDPMEIGSQFDDESWNSPFTECQFHIVRVEDQYFLLLE